MILLKTLQDLKNFQAANADASVGFVPTMGALHAGHIELLKKAQSENQSSVLSIYVNPTQFNDPKDFEKYPMTLEKDLQLAKQASAKAVFLPSYDLLYPDSYQFRIVAPELTSILCGKFRPGHFDGVLTVVYKLFQLLQPTRAYFGEKDYQQFLLIKKMSQAFYLRPEVIGVPTVRETSGLALSSRNVRLSDDGRKKAAFIYKTLTEIKDLSAGHAFLEQNGFRVEYLEEHFDRRFVAAWLEGVRLIDNVPSPARKESHG